MKACRLTLTDVHKRFNRRAIFQKVAVDLKGPGSVAVVGRNGSGKSTLAKIVAGVLSPTSGIVRLEVDGAEIPRVERYRHLGFVSPYLTLYDEFTATENVTMLEAMRSGVTPGEAEVGALLESMGLEARKNDRVGTFSSGMKQRVKYAVALVHRPPLLILDEPTANLDSDGIEFVRQVAMRQKNEGILLVATNDQDEADWCERRIELGKGT